MERKRPRKYQKPWQLNRNTTTQNFNKNKVNSPYVISDSRKNFEITLDKVPHLFKNQMEKVFIIIAKFSRNLKNI